MKKLWILLAVSLLLAAMIDYHDKALSLQTPGRKDKILTFCLIVLLATYSGLRTWCNDTVTYLQMYDQIAVLPDYLNDMYKFAHGFGFGMVTSILKTLGFSAQDYLMFYAFLTTTSYVLFVRRYSISIVFGVFLMFTTGFYTFSFAAIKQCTATAFCLWAVSYALERKWVRYGILIAIAVLFHPYSLVYLIVPLMMFRPWTRWTYIYIIVFFCAGIFLESLIGNVLDVTTLFGSDYTEETLLGEGVNIFRVAVAFVPIALSLVYRPVLFADSSINENLMFNLAMMNALIMFVGLFGTANYFARLANYFLPAQVVVLPWMLNKIEGNDRRYLKLACVTGYLGYFYYENAIVRPFETEFSQISLWEYLSHFL